MQLRNCEVSGPPALVRVWSEPAAETGVLGGLVVVSAQISDRRMISQLIKVAKDTSRVYDERFAALGTLGHFLDSSRNVECFNGDRSERGYYIALTTGFDRPERTGAQRLTSEDKALIRDFMLAFINTTGNMELISIAQIFLRGYH